MNDEPEFVLEVQRTAVLPAAHRADGGNLPLHGPKLSGLVLPVSGDGPHVGGVAVQQFQDEVVGVLSGGEEDETEGGGEDVPQFGVRLVQRAGEEGELAGVAYFFVAQDFGQQFVAVVGQGSLAEFVVVQAGEDIVRGEKGFIDRFYGVEVQQ